MSAEKNRFEAKRWLDTATEDLEAADILRRNNKYSHCCFLCQQSAEKALKSIFYLHDLDPWGHSIVNLISELELQNEKDYTFLKEFVNDARKLDRFYIPTRYPNGLPDITPSKAFGEDDAMSALAISNKIINKIKEIVG